MLYNISFQGPTTNRRLFCCLHTKSACKTRKSHLTFLLARPVTMDRPDQPDQRDQVDKRWLDN